jgi:L-alanine-DL-glutamate epimerase-like enolase superfamily enzyme
MKIQKVTVEILETPVQLEYVAARHAVSNNYHVLVRIRVEGGSEGIGFVVNTRPAMVKSLAHMVDELGQLLVGMDAMNIDACVAKLKQAGDWVGPGGMLCVAVSPLDVALWDLRGKALNLPLYRLLGGQRDRVPTYASDAMWFSMSIDELVRSAEYHVDQGFNKLKLRLGREATPAAEVRRVKAVQDAVGPDVQLMVDIAETWSFHQAVAGGRALQEAGVIWLEDPVDHQNVGGLAHIAATLDMPVAAGEHLYGVAPFVHTFDARAVDIAIIDLARAGGITPWLKVAALAAAKGIPVAGHVMPDVHIHLLCAVDNGHWVEYLPRSEVIFKAPLKVEKGCLVAPDAPGLGVELDEAACARYRRQ